MFGKEIGQEVLNIVHTENRVTSEYLTAMHDCTSTNGTALCTIKVLYPSALDIECHSHMIHRVGENFATPTLYEFSLS